MALTIQQYETPESRLEAWSGKTPDGHTWYVRHYDVPEQNTGVIPSEGDAFPGLAVVSAILGPYVRNVRHGPRRKVPGGGVVLRVILEGRTLAAR